MVHNSLGRDIVGGDTGGGCVDGEDFPVGWSQAVEKNTDQMKQQLFIRLFFNEMDKLQNPSYSL